ncbi:1-aminocyclopropane-1-carboxylate deaminase [Cryptococcus floricola]|uniref:1-aminocyclopropane-1-carboxylate deaminase n=1 Tax=Cryptococcus floricola TaxID=2591691 RepID=A0A5D3ASJ2_9TREE|nr:1-aminocyclopropane-1-carboxylate deaminase [Cryptococcus floricola]
MTQAYINKLNSIPKENFLFGPSPISSLPNLSSHLSPSGTIRIFAKREDCNSGLAYGGNKVRKLEYLVAAAKAEGCDTLVSVGGVQSNHTRAVTAVAKSSGMGSVTVQEKWVPIDPPLYASTGNILLSRLMGGDVRLNQETFDIGHKKATEDAFKEVQDKGGKPYYIPAGASDHPLGGLGFTALLLELLPQEAALGIFFDTIIVCSVTGSSHAGLVVGNILDGRRRKVIGIDASGKPEATKKQVEKIARNTLEMLGEGVGEGEKEEVREEDVVLDDRFHAGIYGIPNDETIAAMRLGASKDAFITDPVYEGKSLAGMIKLIQEGSIKEGSNVLYVHLGGQPALNAYSSYFE